MSDRFARAMKKQDLPFAGPQQIEALRTELHDYLDAHLRSPLHQSNRKAILKAIDNFVERNFSGAECYLRFRDQFNALKWQLWTATEPKVGLTPAEHNLLNEQRSWMQQYIASLLDALPANEAPVRLRGPVEQNKQLESEVFSNPLSPFFSEPMSAEEFEAFKTRVESDKDPVAAPKRIFAAGVYVPGSGAQETVAAGISRPGRSRARHARLRFSWHTPRRRLPLAFGTRARWQTFAAGRGQ